LVEERVDGKGSLVRQRSCPMGIPTGKTAGFTPLGGSLKEISLRESLHLRKSSFRTELELSLKSQVGFAMLMTE